MPVSKLLLLVFILAAGCSSRDSQTGTSSPNVGPQSTSKPNRNSDPLIAKVGQPVTLRGRFGGPGKIADYVVTDGEQVYLTGDELPNLTQANYGDEIVVRGVLQRYDPPETKTPAGYAAPFGHYFIESAQVLEK